MTGKNLTMEKGAAKENQERKAKEKEKAILAQEKEIPGARKGTRREKKERISASSANRIGKVCRSR